MVQRRLSGRRHHLPHLPVFSSFSRALSLCRSPLSPDLGLSRIFSTPKRKSESAGHKRPAKSKCLKSSHSSDGSDEDECLPEEVTVQADFGFFDPKPGDFHGVKLLLHNYLDEYPWDLSSFVDLILGQTTVGTVVKLDGNDADVESGDENRQDDDEDLYAVISVLNIERYSEHRCIVELKKFLFGVCGDDCTRKKLKLLLEQQASDVGLLVTRRFMNCPNQLVPPLYDALFDEVAWATEDEPTQELKDSFRFKFYLLITKIFENKHANNGRAKEKQDSDEPIIYLKVEDEIFHELSSFSFTFHLQSSPFVPHELKNNRAMGLVLVISADAIPKFREKLKSLLDES